MKWGKICAVGDVHVYYQYTIKNLLKMSFAEVSIKNVTNKLTNIIYHKKTKWEKI